jgi:hypothetical protein
VTCQPVAIATAHRYEKASASWLFQFSATHMLIDVSHR